MADPWISPGTFALHLNLLLEVVHDHSAKAMLISELPDDVSSDGERTSTPILAFSFTNWSPGIQVVGRNAKGEKLEDYQDWKEHLHNGNGVTVQEMNVSLNTIFLKMLMKPTG